MFKVNDFIAYGSTGVCRIADIALKTFGNNVNGKLYYVLKPIYQLGTIYTPIDNTRINMRPIISHQEADKLIDLIPTIPYEVYQSRSVQELNEHYQSIIKTYDCANLIKMINSIYKKKINAEQAKRKLGAVDERFMKHAEQLLHGELAIALDIPIDDVPNYIHDRITQSQNA